MQRFTIFRRIYFLVFILITFLGLLFIGITWIATTHFYQASTELLNKDVAAHIAKFTSPFDDGRGLNKEKADSVFQNAMVISPSAEIYFLDTTGKVIYFHAPVSEIRLWKLPIENITDYIASGGKKYMTGPDPRDPSNAKIFSAAAVEGASGKLGYIYVILGSKQFRNTTQMLYNSHVGIWVIGAFVFIIIVSILLSLYYVDRVQRRFDGVIAVLEKFQQGDLTARFAGDVTDDMAPVTESFNKMADLLMYNIQQLTHSEKERKDFMVNISHDLRTPLAIARGYAETLLLKKKNGAISQGEQEEYIRLVDAKIRQVEHMVSQLFELSKMESASFEAKREPFVFSEILQELIHSVKLTASEKGLCMDCIHCTDASWVEGDIRMMERVIQNLLMNAIAYTPRDGRICFILSREGGELVFRIENDGAPLVPDLLRWINDRGSITAARPSRPAIGLTIVKKICQLHSFHLEAGVEVTAANTGIERRVNYFSFRMPVISATSLRGILSPPVLPFPSSIQSGTQL